MRYFIMIALIMGSLVGNAYAQEECDSLIQTVSGCIGEYKGYRILKSSDIVKSIRDELLGYSNFPNAKCLGVTSGHYLPDEKQKQIAAVLVKKTSNGRYNYKVIMIIPREIRCKTSILHESNGVKRNTLPVVHTDWASGQLEDLDIKYEVGKDLKAIVEGYDYTAIVHYYSNKSKKMESVTVDEYGKEIKPVQK